MRPFPGEIEVYYDEDPQARSSTSIAEDFELKVILPIWSIKVLILTF